MRTSLPNVAPREPETDRDWNCATQIPAVKTAATSKRLEVRRVIIVHHPFVNRRSVQVTKKLNAQGIKVKLDTTDNRRKMPLNQRYMGRNLQKSPRRKLPAILDRACKGQL